MSQEPLVDIVKYVKQAINDGNHLASDIGIYIYGEVYGKSPKSINSILYKMYNNGILDKTEGKIPKWYLVGDSDVEDNNENSGNDIDSVLNNLTDLQKDIFCYLEENSDSGPKQIAKELGKTRKEINSELYKLKAKGLLNVKKNNNGTNPRWSVAV